MVLIAKVTEYQYEFINRLALAIDTNHRHHLSFVDLENKFSFLFGK